MTEPSSGGDGTSLPHGEHCHQLQISLSVKVKSFPCTDELAITIPNKIMIMEYHNLFVACRQAG